MDNSTKAKCRARGREDLILTWYILQSGYAGITPGGTIVDRRQKGHHNLTPFITSNGVRPNPTDEDSWLNSGRCPDCGELIYQGYNCKCNRDE